MFVRKEVEQVINNLKSYPDNWKIPRFDEYHSDDIVHQTDNDKVIDLRGGPVLKNPNPAEYKIRIKNKFYNDKKKEIKNRIEIVVYGYIIFLGWFERRLMNKAIKNYIKYIEDSDLKKIDNLINKRLDFATPNSIRFLKD